jgi:BirA family transcriptional regulator, biotin operon repressor / biotin---[acetyl-CoA-carboxylase] ligase
MKAKPAPPPEVVILRALLEAGEGFVSGAALARQLGMSRVAVWQHMEKLRGLGFTFEAVRAKGYRLARPPDRLDATLLAAILPAPLAAGLPLAVFDTVDSTNDEAARRLTAGHAAPFALFARRQLEGRGRLGRVWLSEPNGNLYLSFGFRPEITPARMPVFTLWIGANLCELIARFCQTAPGLKWPNDLQFDGRKVGGILTEARVDADRIRDLVLGIGLNLTKPAGGWPGELRARATSIAEHTNRPLDPNRFAAALLGRVFDAYQRFVDGSYRARFADLWNRHDALHHRTITLTQGTRVITGTARGVDDEGCLLVRTGAGRMERFHAGEVTLAPKS